MAVDTASRSLLQRRHRRLRGLRSSVGTASMKRWSEGQTSHSTKGSAIQPLDERVEDPRGARVPHGARAPARRGSRGSAPGLGGESGRAVRSPAAAGASVPAGHRHRGAGVVRGGAVVSTDVEAPQRWPSHHRTYPPLENGSGYHPGSMAMGGAYEAVPEPRPPARGRAVLSARPAVHGAGRTGEGGTTCTRSRRSTPSTPRSRAVRRRAADRRARGEPPAPAGAGHGAGPARAARGARRRHGLGTRRRPRVARLPGDRVRHPRNRPGRARRDRGTPRLHPRGARRSTPSPATATCSAGSSRDPTPTCSGHRRGGVPRRASGDLDRDRAGHPGGTPVLPSSRRRPPRPG